MRAVRIILSVQLMLAANPSPRVFASTSPLRTPSILSEQAFISRAVFSARIFWNKNPAGNTRSSVFRTYPTASPLNIADVGLNAGDHEKVNDAIRALREVGDEVIQVDNLHGFEIHVVGDDTHMALDLETGQIAHAGGLSTFGTANPVNRLWIARGYYEAHREEAIQRLRHEAAEMNAWWRTAEQTMAAGVPYQTFREWMDQNPAEVQRLQAIHHAEAQRLYPVRDRVYRYPAGDLTVHVSAENRNYAMTSEGAVSVGMSMLMRLLYPGKADAPSIIIAPSGSWIGKDGSNLMACYFFIAANYFFHGRKTKIVARPDQIVRIKRYLELGNPYEFENVAGYALGLINRLKREAYYLADRAKVNGKLQIIAPEKDMVEFIPFDNRRAAINELSIWALDNGNFSLIDRKPNGHVGAREILGNNLSDISMEIQGLPESSRLDNPASRPPFGMTFLGTSSGMDPNGMSSGQIVWAGRHQFLIDIGPTVIPSMRALGLTPTDVSDIVITHLHEDHIASALAYFAWHQKAHAPGTPIRLRMEPGVYKLFAEQASIILGKPLEEAYPIELISLPFYATQDVGTGNDTVRIETLPAFHGTPTSMLRFTYRKQTIGHSSDHTYDPVRYQRILDNEVPEEIRADLVEKLGRVEASRRIFDEGRAAELEDWLFAENSHGNRPVFVNYEIGTRDQPGTSLTNHTSAFGLATLDADQQRVIVTHHAAGLPVGDFNFSHAKPLSTREASSLSFNLVHIFAQLGREGLRWTVEIFEFLWRARQGHINYGRRTHELKDLTAEELADVKVTPPTKNRPASEVGVEETDISTVYDFSDGPVPDMMREIQDAVTRVIGKEHFSPSEADKAHATSRALKRWDGSEHVTSFDEVQAYAIAEQDLFKETPPLHFTIREIRGGRNGGVIIELLPLSPEFAVAQMAAKDKWGQSYPDAHITIGFIDSPTPEQMRELIDNVFPALTRKWAGYPLTSKQAVVQDTVNSLTGPHRITIPFRGSDSLRWGLQDFLLRCVTSLPETHYLRQMLMALSIFDTAHPAQSQQGISAALTLSKIPFVFERLAAMGFGWLMEHFEFLWKAYTTNLEYGRKALALSAMSDEELANLTQMYPNQFRNPETVGLTVTNVSTVLDLKDTVIAQIFDEAQSAIGEVVGKDHLLPIESRHAHCTLRALGTWDAKSHIPTRAEVEGYALQERTLLRHFPPLRFIVGDIRAGGNGGLVVELIPISPELSTIQMLGADKWGKANTVFHATFGVLDHPSAESVKELQAKTLVELTKKWRGHPLVVTQAVVQDTYNSLTGSNQIVIPFEGEDSFSKPGSRTLFGLLTRWIPKQHFLHALLKAMSVFDPAQSEISRAALSAA